MGKESDRRPISLGETALWDDRLDGFRVKAQGNRDVGGVIIRRWARLPISHLDAGTPQKPAKLGPVLREKLEVEVNGAISRGDHTVADGLALLVSEEESKR